MTLTKSDIQAIAVAVANELKRQETSSIEIKHRARMVLEGKDDPMYAETRKALLASRRKQ